MIFDSSKKLFRHWTVNNYYKTLNVMGFLSLFCAVLLCRYYGDVAPC